MVEHALTPSASSGRPSAAALAMGYGDGGGRGGRGGGFRGGRGGQCQASFLHPCSVLFCFVKGALRGAYGSCAVVRHCIHL